MNDVSLLVKCQSRMKVLRKKDERAIYLINTILLVFILHKVPLFEPLPDLGWVTGILHLKWNHHQSIQLNKHKNFFKNHSQFIHPQFFLVIGINGILVRVTVASYTSSGAHDLNFGLGLLNWV